MEVLYERCAGLDVHKDMIVACVREGSGRATRREHERFSTMTAGLMALSEWLTKHEVTHVVMEATGVYWKPVWHVLEREFQLVLANARDVKNMPGRKSDMNDATWLADLLAHGLVRGSFVPPQPIQELRDLTRTRKQLSREIVQHTQRIHKTLEDANVKLSSVLSDTVGKTGMRILNAIIKGETDAVLLAAMAHPRVKASRKQLVQALEGRVTDHHRFLLQLHLDQIAAVEAAVQKLDLRLEEVLRPFQAELTILTSIPGISLVVAQVILAEIGADMTRFPSSGHLISWAGLCPRMDESAGKRRNTRIRDGNAWLKPILVQAAWAATRKKDGYFRAQFNRIKARQGAKKAIVAVAASVLTCVYHMLRDGTLYEDLGVAYFERQNTERTANRLIKRLAALGVEVEIKNAA